LKTKGIKYAFSSTVWKYSGAAGWHFVSLPAELAKEIRDHLKWQEEGWGRIKAVAKVGKSEWDTAIWFDTKMNTYLLPLKAEIRNKEDLKTGDSKTITLWI
jgi:Domain of unknown function (DUF1905)